MRPADVQQILKEDPDSGKEINTNDGRRYLVRDRERWLAGPTMMYILDESGDMVHLAYHNIASVIILKPNGGKRPKAKRRQ